MATNDQKYMSIVCSDVGLLCLSQKLLSKSVSDIGRCLGLDESFVRHIEADSTQDDQHKRHQLLTKWSSGQGSATWGRVAGCFKSLNDDTLMEAIRKIASEMQKPDDEGIHYYCLLEVMSTCSLVTYYTTIHGDLRCIHLMYLLYRSTTQNGKHSAAAKRW